MRAPVSAVDEDRARPVASPEDVRRPRNWISRVRQRIIGRSRSTWRGKVLRESAGEQFARALQAFFAPIAVPAVTRLLI